jgi:SAM-dependent methyltransferase
MIVLTDPNQAVEFPKRYSYCHSWNPITRLVLPCTRYLRARNVERYLRPGIERHLDVGCGDGYFLRRSPARERYGLDPLLGDKLSDLDRLPGDHFDCVTMLAVIEHLEDPTDILRYIWRVMTPAGLLIVTTPKRAAEGLIRLYVPKIQEEHERYFDRESIARLLAPGFDLVGSHTFILGLNQAFCFERKRQLTTAAPAPDISETAMGRECAPPASA